MCIYSYIHNFTPTFDAIFFLVKTNLFKLLKQNKSFSIFNKIESIDKYSLTGCEDYFIA